MNRRSYAEVIFRPFLIAPHINIDQRGEANSGYVVNTLEGQYLLANRNQTWAAEAVVALLPSHQLMAV